MSLSDKERRRLKELDEDISRLWNAVNQSADIVGGVTDHNYLSNRGSIGHSSLDTFYGLFTVAAGSPGGLMYWGSAASHYTYLAVGTASYVLVAGAASPYYGIPVWAASAYSVTFIAASTASVALTQAYAAGSTASVHIADKNAFHGFSIASKVAGDLYYYSTSIVRLPIGTASYVLTAGVDSPYWKAPAALTGTFNLPYCALYHSATSISTATWTTVGFDTERSDVLGWHVAASTTVTVDRAGIYLITAAAMFGGNNTTGLRGVSIYLDASKIDDRSEILDSVGYGYPWCEVSNTYSVASGGAITIKLYQSSGADLMTYPSLNVIRLAAGAASA
jgi:hypothetical protein